MTERPPPVVGCLCGAILVLGPLSGLLGRGDASAKTVAGAFFFATLLGGFGAVGTAIAECARRRTLRSAAMIAFAAVAFSGAVVLHVATRHWRGAPTPRLFSSVGLPAT